MVLSSARELGTKSYGGTKYHRVREVKLGYQMGGKSKMTTKESMVTVNEAQS